ncbi:MAG: hypothetical protein R3F49_03935 [Planctomycetota bacterium]
MSRSPRILVALALACTVGLGAVTLAGPQRGGQDRGALPRGTPERGGQQRGATSPRVAPAQPGATRRAAADDASTESTLAPREGLLRTWFGAMDLNGDTWLSLRETAAGIGFDSGRFRAFDIDRDGRFDLAEYRQFYVQELEQGRVPAAPRNAALDRTSAPRRDPLQLRVAFDRDLDRAIDLREFAELLAAYGRSDLDTQSNFRRADQNGDQRLDINELTRIAVFLDPMVQGRNRTIAPLAKKLEELFGARTERAGVGQPPLIEGPVPPFWRLDLDGDGFVEESDMATLNGRLHVAISARAVLSALDLDGDGKLSKLEFMMSIDSNVRPGGPEGAR